MPTRNPSAAEKFVRRLIRRSPGTEGRVAGGYAVYGGALAYQQTLGLSPADSLADRPAYRSTLAELRSGTAVSVYLNLRRFAQIEAQKSRLTGSLGGLFQQSLSRIGPNAALAAGVTLSPSAIRVDAVETGVRRGRPHGSADVGALPAGSWLALSTGWLGGSSEKQFRAGLQLGLSNSLSRDGLSGGALANALTQRLGFLEQEVLPALGPMSLAVGGTSPLNLTLGLKLTPSKLSAATRLLAMLRGLAARSSSLSVSGTASHFSVRVPTGSQLLVDEIRRAVVATYGYATPSAFLAPSSRLSGDPTFRRALGQLPSGSHVPLYVSFGPIAALVGLIDHQPSAARTVRTLNQLSYLIAGSSGSRAALVLGLR